MKTLSSRKGRHNPGYRESTPRCGARRKLHERVPPHPNHLMEWMYRDFLFSAPALAMAMRYFAPDAPKRGLLKNIQSPDREKAILGARNAAWDMTLLHQWLKMIGRQNSENILTILASRDLMLHQIARALACEEIPNMPDPLEQYIFNLWGDQKGRRNFDSYLRLRHDAENPERTVFGGVVQKFLRCVTSVRFLAASLLAPHPRRCIILKPESTDKGVEIAVSTNNVRFPRDFAFSPNG